MLNYISQLLILRAIVSFVGGSLFILSLDAKSAQVYAQKDDGIFSGMILQQVKDVLAKSGKSQQKINGSDDANNQIPAGTVVVYVTSDNKHGKLKILEYGYNLTISWMTYNPDGSVASNGNKLLVKGTWSYDLDYGVEGGNGKSKVDFWWEQIDQKKRYLVPQNGAMFALGLQSEMPRGQTSVAQWEYKVVRAEFDGISVPQIQMRIESTLNQLGAEGWELVQFQPLVQAPNPYSGNYFFKRPKRP